MTGERHKNTKQQVSSTLTGIYVQTTVIWYFAQKSRFPIETDSFKFKSKVTLRLKMDSSWKMLTNFRVNRVI